MKKLTKIFAIAAISVSMFSCSKKLTTFKFGQPYHQTTADATTSTPQTSEAPDAGLSAETTIPVTGTEQNVSEKLDAKALTPVVVAKDLNKVVSSAPATETVTKPTFKQRVAEKMLKKQIQKMNKGGVSGNIRTGIILAAIGLLLLLFAGVGLFGGASIVFWILGAIGLIVGLVLILLEVI